MGSSDPLGREAGKAYGATRPSGIPAASADLILGTGLGNCGIYFNGHHTPAVPVTITHEDLVRHIAVFGKSGTGKSTLLRSVFNDLVTTGHGAAVLDPKSGDLVRQIAEDIPADRLSDVIYLDLADPAYTFGINLFQSPGFLSPEEKTKRVNQIVSLFRKVGDSAMGPLLTTWLPTIAHTFLDAGEGTFADIPRLLSDTAYRNRLLGRLTNSFARFYWQRAIDKNGNISNEQVGSTMRAFGKFLTNEVLEQVVGQTETTVPFQEILDTNKILLVSLPQDDESTTSLIGTLIFQELFNAAVKRKSTKPFAIIADEAQLVATPDLERFIDEIRARRVGMVLATQRPGKMDDDDIESAMMNVGTLVAYSLDHDDATKIGRRFPDMAKSFQTYIERTPGVMEPAGMHKPTAPADVIMGLQKNQGHGAALVSIQGREAAIRVRQLPEGRYKGQLAMIREASRRRYYRNRMEVAKELADRSVAPPDDTIPVVGSPTPLRKRPSPRSKAPEWPA